MNAVNLVIKRFLLTTLFFKNFLSEYKHCLISLYRKIIFKLQTRSKLLISYNSSPYFDNHFPSLAFQSHDHALIIFFYLSFINFIRILLSFILFFRTRKCNICNKRIEFKETEWIYTTKSPESFFWHQTSISCVLSLYGG